MVATATTKLYKSDSGFYIRLKKGLVEDSNFPLKINGDITITINHNKLIIENKEK
ncbi:hypothetical protein M1293_00825 [Candidatus Parvarchaeota archaeon]|nr:hypothetical protein [Candidatus Parvarchaeota archaeon]